MQRSGALAETETRYVDMIATASGQLSALLDALGLAAAIESGRYDPRLVEMDSLELANRAAEVLGEERVGVEGAGAPVLVDEAPTHRAVTDLARCALRHGGLEHVDLRVTGVVLELGPVTRASQPVLLGTDLRDLGAAIAGRALRATGAALDADDEVLRITLCAAS
jgi:hypothetical protein